MFVLLDDFAPLQLWLESIWKYSTWNMTIKFDQFLRKKTTIVVNFQIIYNYSFIYAQFGYIACTHLKTLKPNHTKINRLCSKRIFKMK